MRTTVDTDRLGDELAAHVDAATHRVLTLIRQFDEPAAGPTPARRRRPLR